MVNVVITFKLSQNTATLHYKNFEIFHSNMEYVLQVSKQEKT